MSVQWPAAERFCSYVHPVADALTSSLWLRMCINLVHGQDLRCLCHCVHKCWMVARGLCRIQANDSGRLWWPLLKLRKPCFAIGVLFSVTAGVCTPRTQVSIPRRRLRNTCTRSLGTKASGQESHCSASSSRASGSPAPMARACPAAIVEKPMADIQIKGELGANHAKLLKDPVAA